MNETKQENNNVENLKQIDLQTVMLILIKKVEELDNKLKEQDKIIEYLVKHSR